MRPSRKDLLTDYKVLVLAVDEKSVSRTFQQQLADQGNELSLDDAAKIVGCWNGLAKRGDVEHSFDADPAPDAAGGRLRRHHQGLQAIETLFASTVELVRRRPRPRGRRPATRS